MSRLALASIARPVLHAVALLAPLATAFPSDPPVSTELWKLTSPGGIGGAQFGVSISVAGTLAVVGAPLEIVGPLTLGRARVYERDMGRPGQWEPADVLTASDPGPAAHFGEAVAIQAGTIVVGAPYDQQSETGERTGATYVFRRVGGVLQEVARLTAENGSPESRFGSAVDVWGDTVVVGAYAEEEPSGPWCGAAYVFERDAGGPGNWGQVAELIPSDSQLGAHFGFSVAICEDEILVGANKHDGELAGSSGAAYVFERNAGGPGRWEQTAKLTASDEGDGHQFGDSVDLSDGVALIGSVGTPGDSPVGGAAYLFERSEEDSGSWEESRKLVAVDVLEGHWFGTSVSLSGDLAVVSSRSDGTGGAFSGAAFVFRRDAGGTDAWGQVRKLLPSENQINDFFGEVVTADAGVAFVGAPGFQGGAAYVFDIAAPGNMLCFGDGTGTACPCGNSGMPGSGCANSHSNQGCNLFSFGTASVSEDHLVLNVAGATPGQVGLFFQADIALEEGQGRPFGDGLRCAGENSVRLELRTAGPSGSAWTTAPIAERGGPGPGDKRSYQFWYRDSASSPCGSGFNLSSGLELVWEP